MKKMKRFFDEFKVFIRRGNVMELAVGVIIGGAFQKIVTSLVGDVVSPLLGLFSTTGLENLSFHIASVEVRYGAFLTAVIDFLIMAFLVFLMVKMINRMTTLGKKSSAEEEDAVEEDTTKQCPYCYREIDARATRCSFCTAELPQEESKPETEERK